MRSKSVPASLAGKGAGVAGGLAGGGGVGDGLTGGRGTGDGARVDGLLPGPDGELLPGADGVDGLAVLGGGLCDVDPPLPHPAINASPSAAAPSQRPCASTREDIVLTTYDERGAEELVALSDPRSTLSISAWTPVGTGRTSRFPWPVGRIRGVRRGLGRG
jgi:hypothetical protein